MLLKHCAVLLFWFGSVCITTGYFHPTNRNTRLNDKSHDDNLLGVAGRGSSLPEHLSKEFYIRYKPSTFWEAIQHCIDEGKRLASIQSDTDTKVLMEMIGQSKEKFWIAGTDIGHENRWIWLNKGEALRYTKWLPAQPDNWNNAEHCLEFDAHTNGHWNDYNCDKCNQFICEDIDKKKRVKD